VNLFDCYEKIIIENPNGTSYAGSFFGFDYVDFTYYGGDEFTLVKSNQDIIDRFADLNIPVKLDGFEIVILRTDLTPVNLTSYSNQKGLYQETIGNTTSTICKEDRNGFDLTPYGFGVEFFYNDEDLKARLEEIFNTTVTITDCHFEIDKFKGDVYNIKVSYDPTSQFIFDGNPVTLDYNTYNGIDLTSFGVNSTILANSDADIIAAFSELGINISIDNSIITFLEYRNTVYDVLLIPIDTFNILGLDFDVVNFPPSLGGPQNLNTAIGIQSYLANNFNINTSYISTGTGYLFSVLDVTLEDITDITTRNFFQPVAVDDTYEFCIQDGLIGTFAILANDSISNGERITAINGTPVVLNTVVSILPGIDVRYIGSGTVSIETQTGAVGDFSFTYEITNDDNQTDSATVNFCVADIPVVNPDTISIGCNTSSGVIDVIANDFSTYSNLVITHINSIPVVNGQSINIMPGLDIINIDTAVGFALESTNNYTGLGTITYTVTNGAFSGIGTVDYAIIFCDPCLSLNLDFPVVNDCAQACYDVLTINGNPVNNYLIEFRDNMGNPVTNMGGSVYQIANGSFITSSTLPSQGCLPLRAGTYSVYIVDSDIGSDLDCSSLTFTINGVPCDSNPCVFSYSGPPGSGAGLQFDVEVGPNSTIVIERFDPQNVPDGMVIEYNGSVIYHTGLSAANPLITGNQTWTTFTCNGINYTAELTPDPVNILIPVPYVAGVNNAIVTVTGNLCTQTFWQLTIRCDV
jgi:hypothetical protein